MSQYLAFQPQITIRSGDTNTEITTFKQFIMTALDRLGITDGPESLKTRIVAQFDKYDNSIFFEIIQRTNITTQIESLLVADDKLTSLLDDPELKNILENNSRWKLTMQHLARLQGLILLKRVSKDCGTALEKLINALNDKLTAVNTLLEEEITND